MQFIIRKINRVAIDGGTATENKLVYTMSLHDRQQSKAANDIVAVVKQRLNIGFTYSLEPCKMNDGVKDMI